MMKPIAHLISVSAKGFTAVAGPGDAPGTAANFILNKLLKNNNLSPVIAIRLILLKH